MQGITVEIADHPTTGHKRKVLIDGLGISWSNEVIGLETICTFYENVNGLYGDPVSVPQPIIVKRVLVARTKGGKIVFVDNRTGAPVLRKTRQVEEPIPIEEQVEAGPTTRMVAQEYWVLESDDITEVSLEYVQELFFFLESILRNNTTIVGQMLSQFVLDEVKYGTYDQV